MASQSQSTKSSKRKFSALSEQEQTFATQNAGRAILFQGCCQGKLIKLSDISNLLELSDCSSLISDAAKIIDDVFGLKLKEVVTRPGKSAMTYKLESPFQYEDTDIVELKPSKYSEWGFLVLVVSFIMAKQGEVTEDDMWSFMTTVGIEKLTHINGITAELLLRRLTDELRHNTACRRQGQFAIKTCTPTY
eukprot:gene8340-880_t